MVVEISSKKPSKFLIFFVWIPKDPEKTALGINQITISKKFGFEDFVPSLQKACGCGREGVGESIHWSGFGDLPKLERGGAWRQRDGEKSIGEAGRLGGSSRKKIFFDF